MAPTRRFADGPLAMRYSSASGINRADLLFEVRRKVEHFAIVGGRDDALGGIKIKRAPIDVAGNTGYVAPDKESEKPGDYSDGDEPVVLQRHRKRDCPDQP